MFARNNNQERGFTLLEVLVVVAIIALLMTIATLAFRTSQLKARNTVRLNNMKEYTTALELYFNTNNIYPIDNNDGLACNCDSSIQPSGAPGFIQDLSPTYMAITPKDPLNTSKEDLFYRYFSDDGETYKLQFHLEPAGSDCPNTTIEENGWCTVSSAYKVE